MQEQRVLANGCHFRDTCRLCESRLLEQVVTLTPTPPGNRVLSGDELCVRQPLYPLEVYFCLDCAHIQLGHVVDAKILYRNNYSYVSRTSPLFVTHLRDYANDAISRWNLGRNDLVVDIGSNDGTCLSFFQSAGLKVLGIDPATEIAQLATERGIPTINDFFDLDLARHLCQKHGPARLVTSHNACAHIDDLKDLVDGVKHWLADDGLFVVEVGYFVDVYQNLWFDTIYHEHLDYHTVTPLVGFLSRLGMQPISVERVASQGGSIRLCVQKKGGPHQSDASVGELIALEESLGLQRAETICSFGERVERARDVVTPALKRLRRAGKTIAGYGAPTKATTLMAHFALGRDVLDFIVDDNPLKQGFFTPANHIPIGPAMMLYERNPDYVLILAWNFAESIIDRHRQYASAGGKFIVPLPELRFIDRAQGNPVDNA